LTRTEILCREEERLHFLYKKIKFSLSQFKKIGIKGLTFDGSYAIIVKKLKENVKWKQKLWRSR